MRKNIILIFCLFLCYGCRSYLSSVKDNNTLMDTSNTLTVIIQEGHYKGLILEFEYVIVKDTSLLKGASFDSSFTVIKKDKNGFKAIDMYQKKIHIGDTIAEGKAASYLMYKGEKIKTAEYFLKNGGLDGVHKMWYASGRQESEANFKNGRNDGITIEWDEKGKIEYTQMWKNGVITNDTIPNNLLPVPHSIKNKKIRK